MLHFLLTKRSGFDLPPFSEERDTFFQSILADPKESGIITFTETVPHRKELLKLARQKLEDLSESGERSLGGYKTLLRFMAVLSLDVYTSLVRSAEKEIGSQLVPAMLERPPNFFQLFMDSKSQFAYTRPEDVMNQLSRFHAKMVASGVWSSILRQFFVDIFQIINVRLFNAIAERSDLCTLDNGFQLKTAISHLNQWANNAPFLDAVATKKQLAHVNEVASFLVAEDTQLLEMDFRVLGPRHLIHFASTRSKSASSAMKKVIARWQQQQRAPSTATLKLDTRVAPLITTDEDYKEEAANRKRRTIVFHETI